MTPPPESVFTLPLPGGRRQLTPGQWRKVEQVLDDWKREVLAAARKHPTRSYRLGVAQAEAFTDLLQGLNVTTLPQGAFGGTGPTMREAQQWAQTYTLHELEDALNVYVGRIKDALLYGLRGAMNPTDIASLMFKATRDASINWRMIARTETARANAAGRLAAIRNMGFDRVWCPPHIGSCKSCKRLVENQDFAISEVEHATNFGRDERDWVACLPVHPNCRHSWLPYDPEVVGAAREQYQRMEEAGLTDEDRLDEMFDSSGQLRPEYAHVDFSAAKTFDPYQEGLAAAVNAVAKRRTPSPPVQRFVSIPALRSDLYQRAVDPDRVLAIVHAIRGGQMMVDDPDHAIEVSERPDGTLWIVDGQHRVEALRLLGHMSVRANVRTGLPWDAEARRCRRLIRKSWNAASVVELPPAPDVPDEEPGAQEDLLAAMLATVDRDSEQPHGTLFDHGRLRDDIALAIEAWWERVAGPDHRAWSRLFVPADGGPLEVQVDYPALRVARPEWRKLADPDLHLAVLAATRQAGRGVAELAPGLPMDVRVGPVTSALLTGMSGRPLWAVGAQKWAGDVPTGWTGKSLADVFPSYAWAPAAPPARGRLLGSDEFEALVTKSHGFTAPMYHVAPADAHDSIRQNGLDRGRGHGDSDKDPNHVQGNYVFRHREDAERYGQLAAEHFDRHYHLWTVETNGLKLHKDPQPGFAQENGEAHYTPDPVEPRRLHHDGTVLHAPGGRITHTVGKAAKPQAANAGVEHWITVHPHGDSEPGQPVLVRNNTDGTMTVIGGAGGNLNYMRLDPSRRVKRDEKTGRSKGSDGAKRTDQPVTPEEHEAAAREREQEVTRAREQLEQVKARQDELKGALHQFVQQELGVDLNDPDLSHRDRQKMLKKARLSALRTLTYGEKQRRDTTDAASPEQLGLDPMPPKDPAEPAEPADGEAPAADRKPAIPLAMSSEQASALLDHFHDLHAIGKIAGQHRRVIAGDAKGSDALQIDWSLGGQEARDERRQKAVEQQARTDLARQLLGTADREYRAGKKGQRAAPNLMYEQAVQRGGFDTVDAFSHSILGQAQLSFEAHKLLGVAGSAQLVAYSIQQEAKRVGKKNLDLDKVQKALKNLTDEQERAVADRGLNRVKRATEMAAFAQTELAASERGESLFTTTMARSMASQKVREAKNALGATIAGLEACSALKTALDRHPGEKLKVGGFTSPARIKELAAKAGIRVGDSDIVKDGTASYTLAIHPERLTGLLRPEKPVDQQKLDRLQGIREGKDFDRLIEAEREPGPGMVHTLDANQAKGKLFLTTAKSGVLAFDPGVGKTHTAIAAAKELMHAEPEAGHRALIVAPTNMLRSWANTLAAQHPGHTVQIVGQSDVNPEKDTTSTAKRKQQLAGDAHFTIVAYESLRSYQGVLDDLHGEGRSHSIVIADELQKAKNENSGIAKTLGKAVDHARSVHGDRTHFWGLTGTPIEKNVSDLHSMVSLSMRAKGQEPPTLKQFAEKHGKQLGEFDSIARGDKIGQFRKGVDEHLFRLTAEAAGNALPDPVRTHHKVELDDEHRAEYQARVNSVNEQIAQYHATKDTENPTAAPAFGGRQALMDALYNRESSALHRKVADNIEATGSFTHGGKEYEHKHVVFGASETSKALFGQDWNKGAKSPGGLHKELEDRGIKVFVGHGSMSSAQNEANYKAFLAHQGKAVFLTNDKNNAGISLQFGENNGQVQHGATHMHHFTVPVNNATIQQREARILRKGAQAKVQYHTYDAGTPIEQRLRDTLESERRTQDLAANSEQQVSGQDTLAHHLQRAGVKAPSKRTDAGT